MVRTKIYVQAKSCRYSKTSPTKISRSIDQLASQSVNLSLADQTVGKWSAPSLVGQLVGRLVVDQLVRPVSGQLTSQLVGGSGQLVRLVGRPVGLVLQLSVVSRLVWGC